MTETVSPWADPAPQAPTPPAPAPPSRTQAWIWGAISTDVYGYPPAQAALVAVGTVREALDGDARFEKVVFCCFSEPSAALHRAALEAAA